MVKRGTGSSPRRRDEHCTLWVFYGLLQQPKRDWPIVIANAPGIVFGLAAAITALDVVRLPWSKDSPI